MRRMMETAARLVELVFPAVAERQWSVVLPKRLRHFLRWDAGCLDRVMGIPMRAVQCATARDHQHIGGSARAACSLCTALARLGTRTCICTGACWMVIVPGWAYRDFDRGVHSSLFDIFAYLAALHPGTNQRRDQGIGPL